MRQDTQVELTDLIRERTELECLIKDLRLAGVKTGEKRSDIEAELARIEEQIKEKEEALRQVLPAWETQRARENLEKRQLDDASAKLSALYAKQGRVNRFRTKSDRDKYLQHEMASLGEYRASQMVALEATRAKITSCRQSVIEADESAIRISTRMVDERNRIRDLSEQLSSLKDERVDMIEKKKDLWREDTKLVNQLRHSSDQLNAAERALATMMDKVVSISLSLPDISNDICLSRTQAWDFVRLIKLLRDMAWTAYMGLSIVCLRLPTKTLAPPLN
jgi:structural maintenance of chromosome 3 (chondroitin sulfate proteoglycan 6)